MTIPVVLGRKRLSAYLAGPRFNTGVGQQMLLVVLRINKRSVTNLAVVGPFSSMNTSDVILQQSFSFKSLRKRKVSRAVGGRQVGIQLRYILCHIRHT